MKKKSSAMRMVASMTATGALIGLVVPALAIDFTISGFIQHQIAVKLSDKENENNQSGDPYNGKQVPLEPMGLDLSSLAAVNNLLTGLSLPPLSSVTNPLFGQAVSIPPTGYRDVASPTNDFNHFMTRLEVNMGAMIDANWSASLTMRAVYEWNPYHDVSDVNFYETQFRDGGGGTPLEYADKNFMIDFPVAKINFTSGPLVVQVGNQVIAWGEAVFFRVMDVPNGLDLRRHLILDPALEEFSDKRVPGLGIRASYQVTPDWEVEAFIQKFEPTIYPNPSTPYNIIPDQFTLHERYKGIADDVWNVGGRIRGQLGNLGLQFFAVSRHNPDGAIRWTKSGVNKDISPLLPGSGAVAAETPFERDEARGVKSQEEWFHYAGNVRLNGVTALNSAVDDFQPATGSLTAYNVGDSQSLAAAELDTFFWLSGGLRGHIERVFPYENVFGASINYVFDGEPGSFLEQLITRVEFSYTPNKVFTAPSLSKGFQVEDEWAAAAVVEKWYRWSEDFPAAYLVAQYLYKSAGDIFGRSLDGFGGTDGGPPGKGLEDYHAVAFAGFQPSPSLEWRFEWAVLYDLRGGFYVQPGVRWKPDDKWQVDLHASVFAGDRDNYNALSTLDFADEVSLRVTYQF
ncbi:DUF1302 family protein [Oleomonas cavernae]|uniref:DUF1302 family protein n=1 Tax=Oleomonas cavernae TaxID=2320859 RepID=A0A418WH57_9PROT|nr:DUF1302 family protein [Oleomonas cavernae]RJF89374.1 DUF1302 family protein [Oleomonas cavernae]